MSEGKSKNWFAKSDKYNLVWGLAIGFALMCLGYSFAKTESILAQRNTLQKQLDKAQAHVSTPKPSTSRNPLVPSEMRSLQLSIDKLTRSVEQLPGHGRPRLLVEDLTLDR